MTGFKKNGVYGIVMVILVLTILGCSSSPDQKSTTSDGLTDTAGPLQNASPGNENMILIPAGEFEMGGNPDQGLAICQELFEPYSTIECNSIEFIDEGPVHTVSLDEYYIDKFEVTNADYQVCVEDGSCDPDLRKSSSTRDNYYGNPEYADYPVINVSWDDAQTYCDWRGARLPTEAEWEKAARGTDGRIYPWGDDFDGSLGNFCDRDYGYDDGYSDTAPVGNYPGGASPYGVMDMAGNVQEWIADGYDGNYYSNSPTENPGGVPDSTMRVLRGGSWRCSGYSVVRTAFRGEYFPDFRINYIGFRCAVSSP